MNELKHSEQMNKLAEALAKVNEEIRNVPKQKENKFFASRYSDLATVYEICRKTLAVNGLSVIQTTKIENDNTILITTLLHSSGQWIASEYPIRPVKQDPQGYGSAMTYARRYSLMAIVGIAAEDEDDDGNAASSKEMKPTVVTPKAKKSAPEKLSIRGEVSGNIAHMLRECTRGDEENMKDLLESLTQSEDANGNHIEGTRTLTGLSINELKKIHTKVKAHWGSLRQHINKPTTDIPINKEVVLEEAPVEFGEQS